MNMWDGIPLLPGDGDPMSPGGTPSAPSPAARSSGSWRQRRRVVPQRSSSTPSFQLPEPVLAQVILPPSDDPVEDQVAILRMQMIGRMGSAKAAFQAMDTNGSGNVSFNEFERTFPKMLGLTQQMPDYYQST